MNGNILEMTIMVRHKKARAEIIRFAKDTTEFTTTEVFYHLIEKGRSFELNRQQLTNILARSPSLEKSGMVRTSNRIITSWRYAE